MKLFKILVIIGLVASHVIKTDYIPPCILDDLKRTSKTGSVIAEFFKNNAVSWENSIFANYIKTTKQVGNNIVRLGNNIVRLAKKKIDVLNYWDLKEKNKTLDQQLKTAQKSIEDTESIIGDLREKNQSLDQVLEIANKALIVKDTVIENNIKVINNLNQINDDRIKKNNEIRQAISEIDKNSHARHEKQKKLFIIIGCISFAVWGMVKGYELFQNWKKSKKKSKIKITNFSHI